MQQTVSSKKDQIVTTAIELFRRDGFHATGIDKIVEESGVTKRTLYRYFGSKDKLVVAALEKHHEQFVDFFGANVIHQSQDPREQLLAVFDVAFQWFSEDDFYGCMFINAVGEYADTKSKVRRVAQDFKKHIRSFISSTAANAGAEDPDDLAGQLSLLLEGAIVTAQVSNNPNAAKNAQKIAKQLIDRQFHG